MRRNILIGGAAGQGVDTLTGVIAGALAKAGFYVFNYRDYQSLIRGGHNYNIVCFSDEPVNSYDDDIDILIPLDENTLKLHKGKITADSVDATRFGQASNMIYAGFVFKILGLDKKFVLETIKEKFEKNKLYSKNIEAAEEGYSKDYEINWNLKPSKEKGVILTGSEAIGAASISAGLEIYYGYPMTPSTGVLTYLAQHQSKNLFVFSMENEIAAINAALGASLVGKRAMTGTSDGGFDLMTEAVSLQGCSELPLVLHLAQRTGPSTGVPTYTAQSAINTALYGGHGDFPRVVISPGDPEEAYKKTFEAFYLSEKFGVLSILLTDKHLAESQYLTKIIKPQLSIPQRKEYAGKGLFKRSSYEHDSIWQTTEDPAEIAKSVEARLRRTKKIYQEVTKFDMYSTYGSGDNLIISAGSNKGAILDSLKHLKNFKYLHLMYLKPFPNILRYLKRAKKIYVVEQNASGQLANLIEQETKISMHRRILKYNSKPFTPKDIIEGVKNV